MSAPPKDLRPPVQGLVPPRGGATTTVRIDGRTRERLRHFDGTADQVINAALDALDRERYRKQAQQDALRLAADPAERAEAEGIQRLLATPLDELE